MTRIAIAFLATTLALTAPALSQAAVLHVDCTGSGDYLTVQEAVDAADPGDTLAVAACVYEEKVTVFGKHLVIQGAGAAVTDITTAEVGHALSFDGFWAGAEDRSAQSEVTGLTLTKSGPYSGGSVEVLEGYVVFRDCATAGLVIIGSDDHGSAEFHACDIDEAVVGGVGDRLTVYDSDVGTLRAAGGYGGVYYYGIAESYSSTIGTFRVDGGIGLSHGDEVSSLRIEHHVDSYSSFEAVDSFLGDVRLEGGGDVDLENCEMDSVVVHCSDVGGYLPMTGCLVRGDIELQRFQPGTPGFFTGPNLDHCTILGECWWWTEAHTSNRSTIFVGTVFAENLGDALFENCDLVGVVHIAPDAVLIDCISEDPLFCDAEGGDYTLQDCSPCVGAAHDGGDIGAFGVGCECGVAVEDASWGRIKSLFR
jgi:hypothetical protein